MEKVRIAICDDDSEFAIYLKKYLNNTISLCVEISIFNSLFDLIENIGKFDVLFLDYELPYMDGITILEKIQNTPLIKIMISNYDSISFDTYKYKLFWFVRKSHLDKDLSRLIPCLSNELTSNKIRKFTVMSSNKYLTLEYKCINYIVTESNYIYIHTNLETYKIRSSFNSILDQFSNQLFVIPIYGVLINIEYILYIDFHKSTIYLKNNESFSISRKMKKGVMEAYAKYNNHIY